MMPRTIPRTRAICVLCTIMALATTSCTPGSDASNGDTVPTVGSADPVTSDPDIDSTLVARGSSPDDPAPVGDPDFDLIGFSPAADIVDASMLGLIPIPLAAEGSGTGSCIAALSVVSVRETGALGASFSSLPRVDLRAGDVEIGNDFTECDASPTTDAGYQLALDIRPTSGTQVAVAEVFHVDDGVEPTALLLGGSGEESSYYDLTVLDAVPPVADLAVGSAPVDLLTAGGPEDAVELTSSGLDDTSVFDVGVFGIVAVERSEFGDQPGTCVTVLSTLLGVESPGAIVSSFAIPEIGLLAGGQIRSEATGGCDVDTLQELGYFSVFGVIVAVDNTFALQTPFLLPDGVTPDAIVVGDPTVADASFLFEPTALDEAPPAPPRENVNPAVDLVAVGAPISVDDGSGATWAATINGLVPLAGNADGATCYAVVGERSADDDSTFPPDIGIIADGALYGGRTLSRASCDTTALLAAGYNELNDLDTAEAPRMAKFFVSIFVPDDVASLGSIAVGDAESDDATRVAYIEPTVIDAAP